MKWGGHLTGGVLAVVGVEAAAQVHGTIVPAMIAVALFASLVPDFDEPGSKISRTFWMITVPLMVLRLLLSNPVTWILFGRERMRMLVKHRGATHTLVSMLVASLAFAGVVVLLEIGLAHRGFEVSRLILVHSRWIPAAWLGGRAEVCVLLWLAFAAGYFSHLFLDMMTVTGVPLLWPWAEKRYHVLPALLRFTTR